MRNVVRLNAGFALFVCLGLMGFMALQLYTQAQVRSMVPGAHFQSTYVTQKAMQESHSWRRANQYWVSWSTADIHRDDKYRVQIAGETWAKLQIGSPITLAYAGIDSQPFLRNDQLFASNGQIFLNICFFLGALGAGIWMLAVLFAPKPAPAPVPPWEQW